MPQNTLEIVPSPSQETVVSIASRRESKVSTKYNKPHCIVPIDDMRWVTSQPKIVQTLWQEAWSSDQFGSRWMKLHTSLSDKSFATARKILYQTGLFEFKRETCIDDSRKTAGWMVINLHGARRIQEFWLADTTPEIDPQNLPSISQNENISVEKVPTDSKKIPISSQNLPSISPESIEKSSIPEPLSISSETSQELLKEVPEEVDHQVKTRREVLEGLRALGTKTGEKLAKMLEARLKLLEAEASESDYYKEKFERQFRWRITPDRLEKLMQLNNECRAVFFSTFDNLYKFGNLLGSQAFDQAIKGMKEHTEFFTDAVKRQREYWDFVCKRREQILGNT
jgi:hypothetical protein